jgi:hypothetical protein
MKRNDTNLTMENGKTITIHDVREGDLVRSYDSAAWRDSPERAAYFVEGRVEAVVDHPDYTKRYRLMVTRDVYENREITGASSRVGQMVYPPVNGTPHASSLEGVCCGVERL